MAGEPRVLRAALLLLLLLLAPRRALADCTVAQTGTLRGQLGLHTETLRPGQRSLRFAVPPVCAEQNGMRAVACETVAAADGASGGVVSGSEGGAGGGGAEAAGDAPLVEIAGRDVSVTRVAGADGFAMLAVELYCALPDAPN